MHTHLDRTMGMRLAEMGLGSVREDQRSAVPVSRPCHLTAWDTLTQREVPLSPNLAWAPRASAQRVTSCPPLTSLFLVLLVHSAPPPLLARCRGSTERATRRRTATRAVSTQPQASLFGRVLNHQCYSVERHPERRRQHQRHQISLSRRDQARYVIYRTSLCPGRAADRSGSRLQVCPRTSQPLSISCTRKTTVGIRRKTPTPFR